MQKPARALLRATSAAMALAAACAHAPALPETSSTSQGPEKMVITGSRIPQRVDPRTGLPPTMSPVNVYTREDLLRTGLQWNLAAALGRLETAAGP